MAKELLWSGQVGGLFGENLEGLTVGPRLANGDWVLVGVVDDGDPVSANTLVTFALSLDPEVGDYNADALIDSADLGLWQSAFGGGDLSADGNGDQAVNAADYVVWRDALTSPTTVPLPQASTAPVSRAVPEPSGILSMLFVGLACLRRGLRPS